jgi:glutaredoxin
VNGKNRGAILLYALSTCQWCHKTKELLEDLGVAFDYEYVDLLGEKEQDAAVRELQKWNPTGMFPTLVIDNSHAILGFREQEIKKALAG